MSVIMIDAYLESRNKRSRLIATVHDSIVIDMPSEEVEEVTMVAKYIMENLPIDFLNVEWKGETIRYPIAADVEVGPNYNDVTGYDAEEYKTFKSGFGYAKFHNDIQTVKDYEESKLITEEDKERTIEQVKNSIDAYRTI